MKSDRTNSAPSGFSVHDALYIIFKHKWKILVLTAIGLAVAAVMFLRIQRSPTYKSTAQLMVRYLVDRRTVDLEAGSRINNGGMMAQIALIRSGDTAFEIAEAVGPEKLIPDAVTPPTVAQAAVKVRGGLQVSSPKASRNQTSNMLNISYRSVDPALAVEVLDQVIKTYFKRHLELHRSSEAFAQVQKQTDLARSKLRQTEEEINRLKEESGVLTIEATMAEFEVRRRGIRQAKLDVDSMLAQQRAKVAALEIAYENDGTEEADALAEPELESADSSLTDEELVAKRERSRDLDEYRNLGRRFEMLQQRKNKALLDKKPSHPMVKAAEAQIEVVRSRAEQLLEKNPDFAGVKAGSQQAPVVSLDDEKALVAALEAQQKSVDVQVKSLDSEVSRLSALGFKLAGLERQRQVEEEKYRYFNSSLEKARIDETLDSSKIPNISILQNPSPAVKSIDTASMKLIAGVAGSGLALGLALAFLIEMVIDRRVSRPTEIETRLQLPLLMSIPYIASKDGVAKLLGVEPGLEHLGDAGDVALPPVPVTALSTPEETGAHHFITDYASAIRDRIIFNFEVNNITHKPKLIGVTGLSEKGGTSTVAAGLAKAFADDGDRKVLLVDLNSDARGNRLQNQPTDSLVKALQISRAREFRESPRSLYYASAPTRRQGADSYSLAPTKLNELMPYLNASDFDYIIFDLPTVTPTSPTQTMAGFMDKVLLVLDAQRTTRENLQWGYSELQKSRADVSCVYNKARNHAPRWIAGAV